MEPRPFCRFGWIFKVHHPWHPLICNEVQALKRERHAAGVLLRVLSAPGEERPILPWMLDEVSCAHMEPSEPRASLPPLADLQHLLIGSGTRRGCREGACESREDNAVDRPSTMDRNPALRTHPLLAAGCERIFVENAPGMHRDRPELRGCS